jgi:hypothetical protein
VQVSQAQSSAAPARPFRRAQPAALLQSLRRFREPLKRADAHGVSDLSPPTVIPCALPRNEPCCAGQVTPSSTRSDPTLPVAHLPLNRSR